MDLTVDKNMFFLGATTALVPNWEKMLPEPPVPKTLTKPEAIATRKAADRAKQERSARSWPIVGYVDSLCILDMNGEAVLSCKAPEGNYTYCGWQLHTLFEGQRLIVPRFIGGMYPVRWFGLGIHNMLKMLAMEAMRASAYTPPKEAKLTIYPTSWFHPTFDMPPFLDPYTMVTSADQRNGGLTLARVLEHFNIQVLEPGDDAAARAKVARQLVQAMGMTGPGR